MDNNKNIVIGLLSSDAFVQVNKHLAKSIGFVEAGLVGELIATYKMCKGENDKFNFFKNGEKGEWFYLTQPTIEARIGITRSVFETAMRNINKHKLIEKKRLGLPAKNYYLLKWENILALYNGENKAEKQPKKQPKKEANKVIKSSPKDTKSEAQPLALSDCRISANKEEGFLQTRQQDLCEQESRFPAIIKTSNKNKEIKTNNENNSKPLTHTLENEIDYNQLKLPQNLQMFLKNNREMSKGLGLNIYDIELFYNTSPHIKENCSNDDIDYLNKFDFYLMLKIIYKETKQPVRNTIAYLNKWALQRLSFKRSDTLESIEIENGNEQSPVLSWL